MIELLHIGFGNTISIDRVLAITNSTSVPIKRAIWAARDKGKLIDISYGRKTKSAIFFDTGHIALSILEPATISLRYKRGGKNDTKRTCGNQMGKPGKETTD